MTQVNSMMRRLAASAAATMPSAAITAIAISASLDQRRQVISEQHHAGAAENEEYYREIVDKVVDDQCGNAVSERHALAQQRDLGCFAKQWSSEGEKTNRFAAEPRRECLKEIETPVLSRHGQTHGDRPQNVARAANRQHKEKAEPDAEQSIEERLQANLLDYEYEQAQAKQEGYCL